MYKVSSSLLEEIKKSLLELTTAFILSDDEDIMSVHRLSLDKRIKEGERLIKLLELNYGI